MNTDAPIASTEPAIDDTARLALAAALRSPAPLVQVPPEFHGPGEAAEVAKAAQAHRRVLIQAGSFILAVRPKLGCKTCNGSAAWRLKRGDETNSCVCVNSRVTAALTQPAPRVSPKKEPKPQVVVDAGRAARLTELEMRLAGMEKERDAALAVVQKRTAEHLAAADAAGAQLRAIWDERAALATQSAELIRIAEEHEEQARAARQRAAGIEDERSARGEALEVSRRAHADAAAASLAAGAECQRLADRWADRMRPLVRAVERLRAKLPPVHFEIAAEVNGDERTVKTACDTFIEHGADVTPEAMGYSADRAKVRGCGACVAAAEAAT